jgi:starch phosphorylase
LDGGLRQGTGGWERRTTLEADFPRVSDEKLWELRTAPENPWWNMPASRWTRQLAAVRFGPGGDRPEAKHLFDPNVLTLGFARRFATYKRPDLLLHDRSSSAPHAR